MDIRIDLAGVELLRQEARAAHQQPQRPPHLAVELVDILEILLNVFPEWLLYVERILSAAVTIHTHERLAAVLAMGICRHAPTAYAAQTLILQTAAQLAAATARVLPQRSTHTRKETSGDRMSGIITSIFSLIIRHIIYIGPLHSFSLGASPRTALRAGSGIILLFCPILTTRRIGGRSALFITPGYLRIAFIRRIRSVGGGADVLLIDILHHSQVAGHTDNQSRGP